MKKLIFLIFIFFLVGCTALGTRTIYKAKTQKTVQRMGYCTLSNIDDLSSICPEIAYVFDSTICKFSNIYSLDIPLKIRSIESDSINKDLISEICEQSNLDALLVTNLQFIRTTYTLYYAIPIMSNYDTEVMMQLYDRGGELLYATKHETRRGNSYMKTPTTERTVHDGVKGAFARIAKEIGWENKLNEKN